MVLCPSHLVSPGVVSSGVCAVAFPTSATVFDITNNSFTGPVPDTRGSPELWGLLAGGNKLDGPLPPTFGAASNSLRVLDLGDNQLGSQLAATAWEEMTQIQHISLRGNQLAGAWPAEVVCGRGCGWQEGERSVKRLRQRCLLHVLKQPRASRVP